MQYAVHFPTEVSGVTPKVINSDKKSPLRVFRRLLSKRLHSFRLNASFHVNGADKRRENTYSTSERPLQQRLNATVLEELSLT